MAWTIGVLGFDSRWGLGIFLFTTASRTVLGPTQPPVQWVPGALSLGVMRPGLEADHSPPFSAEVKEWVELYFHSSNTPSWRGAQLKHRDNFTFYLYLTSSSNCEVQTNSASVIIHSLRPPPKLALGTYCACASSIAGGTRVHRQLAAADRGKAKPRFGRPQECELAGDRCTVSHPGDSVHPQQFA
jgi:hypothetical protein